MNTRCSMPLLALLSGLSATAVAAGAPEPVAPEDEAALHDLLAIIEEQTAIATKTQLNADYVPGIVSVLHGNDLEAQGVRTVWEALGRVAGIETSMDRVGGRTALVRGLGAGFASGKLKMLVDGVAMNSALSAMAHPLMDMPLEQVERIEVIRGPGSAVHGEFAYQGLVNVVTRRQGQRVFAAAGSFDSYVAGGQYAWSEGERRFSLNLARSQTQGSRVTAGPDALYETDTVLAQYFGPMGIPTSQKELSNAPGPINDRREYESIIADYEQGGFGIRAQVMRDLYGDHFGLLNVLSAPDNGLNYVNEYITVEGRYLWNPAPALEAGARGGLVRYLADFDVMLVPEGYYAWLVPQPLTVLPNGYHTIGRHLENRYYANLDLTYSGFAGHTAFMSVAASSTRVDEAWQKNTLDEATGMPQSGLTLYEHGFSWTENGDQRQLVSLTLQDEYAAREDVTVTAGVRYDNYSDVGDAVSPRLAAVWRITRNDILKAQYGRAFRPPTFYELSFTPDVKPETIETWELAYTRRTPGQVSRAVLFHSELDDLIISSPDALLQYANLGAVTSSGIELELERSLGTQFKWDGSLSWFETEDRDSGRPVPGTASLLGRMSLIYQPSSAASLALDWRYVGEREREQGDDRGPLSDYQVVNLTGSLYNLGAPGLTARLGVQNLFDEDVRYPAPLTLDATQTTPIHSYRDDYPQPGRQWWLQFGYSF